MTDYDDLRAKAQAATPGPWWAVDNSVWDAPTPPPPESDDDAFGEWCGWRREDVVHGYRSNVEADVEFIAAANPAVVLALLDEIAHWRGGAA